MAAIKILTTSKIDSCLNSYREVFSDPLKSGDDNAFNPGVTLPLDFNLEMDGLSGIIPHSAFVIPSNSLPKSYKIQTGTDVGKQKVAFILHTIEQNFSENKWTTKLTGQTLNIRFEPITEEEKKQIQSAKDFQKSLSVFSSPTMNPPPTKPKDKNKQKVLNNSKGTGSVSKTIKEEYIPALEKAIPNGRKGIKLLMTAQTQMEGFKSGTKAYRTNNPGNIGNTDNGGTNRFATLEDGIKGQYKYTEGVALNTNNNYKTGARTKRPAIYDKDSAQNYPGIDFVYTGTLDQYLKIYSTGARKYNTYLNLVVSYFAKNGYTITGNTTIKEIYDIK